MIALGSEVGNLTRAASSSSLTSFLKSPFHCNHDEHIGQRDQHVLQDDQNVTTLQCVFGPYLVRCKVTLVHLFHFPAMCFFPMWLQIFKYIEEEEDENVTLQTITTLVQICPASFSRVDSSSVVNDSMNLPLFHP